ncbi:hypothetical protein BBP40_011309 [Aspergillus hancockii]|nr:hypothetical protein BBP40_011309 [Aspergillus hancockii]
MAPGEKNGPDTDPTCEVIHQQCQTDKEKCNNSLENCKELLQKSETKEKECNDSLKNCEKAKQQSESKKKSCDNALKKSEEVKQQTEDKRKEYNNSLKKCENDNKSISSAPVACPGGSGKLRIIGNRVFKVFCNSEPRAFSIGILSSSHQ